MPIVAFLLSGCGQISSAPLNIEVLNPHEIATSRAIIIRVCSGSEINPAELVVNIYVTENKQWGNFKGALPYTHYFNDKFAGIPGTISPPIDGALWQATDRTCYTAILADVFIDTGDWVERGLCPFNGIIVVANYKKGAWNAARALECKVSS